VPRAQGVNPFHTTDLSNLTDEDLLRDFEQEVEIAQKKPERKLGFARAIESIREIESPLVMDYGSGIGFYGLEILTSHSKAHVTFADINPENLFAIERITKVKNFQQRSAFALIADPEAKSLEFAKPFDLIVSMGVLHHTPYAPQIVKNLTSF
jgi:2-polyprenyl-3-methyl-5-hydroxy-6-metoxy-1,4-benzoquinol methylase